MWVDGLGDRHQQIVDPSTGSEQAGRISQSQITNPQSPEYFLGDALGSVRQLADATGVVTLTQSYASYGEVTQSVGASQTSYAFMGEIRDANGLTFLRARYLDSSTGRFTQRDPSGLEANLYLYAGANPINKVDPTGLFSRQGIAYSLQRGSYTNFLNSMEDPSSKYFPKWGLVAALLEAQPGDSLTLYSLDLMNGNQPHLKKWKTLRIGYNETQGILWDGWTIASLFPPSFNGSVKYLGWRDMTYKYYYLDHRGGENSRYVDGAKTTDYPDFVSTSFAPFSPKSLAEAIEALSRKQLKGCIGLGGSYSQIVDRFGNRYWAVGVSGGIGGSFGSYAEGYVASSAHDVIFNRTKANIASSEQMKRSIQGIGGGVNASFVVGRGASGGLWWPGVGTGSGILTYSYGAQMGASYDLVITTYKDTKPSLGWNWALDDQYYGVMRSDVE